MNPNDPEPPARNFTINIEIPSIGQLPEPLIDAFTHCYAEAQMLEDAIKSAISKDVSAFASASDASSFLDRLATATLGQAEKISNRTSSRKEHKQIAACVGFFDFVKMQWGFSGRPESELADTLQDAIKRRNRIAHGLLVEVLCSSLPVADAVVYLLDSKKRLFELRKLITIADGLSSQTGSVGSDGNSRPRFKTT